MESTRQRIFSCIGNSENAGETSHENSNTGTARSPPTSGTRSGRDTSGSEATNEERLQLLSESISNDVDGEPSNRNNGRYGSIRSFVRFTIESPSYDDAFADKFSRLSRYINEALDGDVEVIAAHVVINSVILEFRSSEELNDRIEEEHFKSLIQQFVTTHTEQCCECTDFTLIPFKTIRNELLELVCENIRSNKYGSILGKNSGLFPRLLDHEFVSKEGKEGIKQIMAKSATVETKEFERLLDSDRSGVMEATINYIIYHQPDHPEFAINLLLIETSMKFRRPDPLGGTVSVMGVCASANDILAVAKELDVIYFVGDAGKNKKFREMKTPVDIISHGSSIFISDDGASCLWKLEIGDLSLERPKLEQCIKKDFKKKGYHPTTLTKSVKGELIIRVKKGPNIEWIVYNGHKLLGTLELKSPIENLYFIAPYKTGSYIVIYQSEKKAMARAKEVNRRVVEIKEADEYNEPLLDPKILNAVGMSQPEYLAVSKSGTIFIADQKNFRIIILRNKRSISILRLNVNEEPHRLCFDEENQRLIVGLTTDNILIFELPH